MRNGEFNIDRKSKTVVFCQESHGKLYYGKSKCDSSDDFDVVKGQLIAMKRCELNGRKDEIANVIKILYNLKTMQAYSEPNKLWMHFIQEASETLKQHYNHVRELKKDIQRLTENDYPHPTGNVRYQTVDGLMKLIEDTLDGTVKIVENNK